MSTARCSVRSLLIDEPMIGTASRVRRYVLLEAPGPWGVDALRDARLSVDLKRELRRRSRATGVRVLLIRRFGRRRSQADPQVFVVDTNAVRPSVAAGRLADHRDVLDLDLWAPGAPGSPQLQPHHQPLFLVCTHGRHDPCCAEQGRPLVRALSTVFPDQTWESSHLGGDRFAGNLLCLPHGISYGRVAPASAEKVASEYAKGRLDLTHLRGRGSYPFAAQVAEWHLRSHLRMLDIDDVLLVEHRLQESETVSTFVTPDGRSYAVRVLVTRATPRRLTCGAEQTFAAPRFQLLDIRLLA